MHYPIIIQDSMLFQFSIMIQFMLIVYKKKYKRCDML